MKKVFDILTELGECLDAADDPKARSLLAVGTVIGNAVRAGWTPDELAMLRAWPRATNRKNPDLDRARKLAAALRAAKSTHAWTSQECGLLANLCTELGVDAPEHAELVNAGEAMVAGGIGRHEKPRGG